MTGPDISHASEVVTSMLIAAKSPCITCSFQAEDVVVLHLLRQRHPEVPVLFLDTFHHFAATLAYRDELTDRWALNLVNVKADEPQVGLWKSSTDDCCARHKVTPLFAALERHDVWFTGLRRAQSPSRAKLEEVETFRLGSGTSLLKVSPLAHWTTKDVWTYARRNDIPLLPLYEVGYSSVGCEPCTALPDDPANPRSGRWGGKKLECGIHIEPVAD